MSPEQQWWYLDQLKRKTSAVETDIDRVDRLLQRPHNDRQTHNRLKLERDTLAIRLTKLKRGLLF